MLQQSAMPAFRVPFYQELAARPGIDLEVLYGTMAIPNIEAPGVKTEHRDLRKLPGDLTWDWAHMKKLRPGAYDAVSMSWNVRFLTMLPAIARAKRAGIGVVLWGHGYSKREGGAGGAMRAKTRLRAAEMADAVVLYTRTIADKYINEYGLPAEKVFAAQNCIPQGPVQAAREKVLSDPAILERFRAEQGLGEGPVFLFVSRLYEDNGVPLLLDAAARLAPDFPDLKVVVIGKGPDMEPLNAKAAAAGLGERAMFLGAIYEEDTLAKWFLSSTAFCYPKNIGLSILHAMGYGLPVVTSDDIGSQNPEIEALVDGENGLLYEHGSVEALAETLRRLAVDGGLRDRLSREAHRTATEVYTVKAMADGMEAALRYAAGKARERRAR